MVEDPDCFFAEWFADLCDWGCEDCSVFDLGLEADVGFVAEEVCEDLFAELVGEGEEGDGEELLVISCGSWEGLGEAYEDECPG